MGKPEGKKAHGKPRRRGDDNIRRKSQELGWDACGFG